MAEKFQRPSEEELQQIVQRIVEAFNPERIILFGSYAYGEPTPDSDIDLLVIMESDAHPVERERAISRLFLIRTFPMDILVRTPQEITERLNLGDCFIGGGVTFEQAKEAVEVMKQVRRFIPRKLPRVK